MKAKNLGLEGGRTTSVTYRRVTISGQFEIVSESIEGVIGDLTRSPWQRRSPDSTNPSATTPLLFTPAAATLPPNPNGRQ